MDEVSDHSSDREQERRQKRRHEEPPATAEAPAIPPFPESGIPNPFTFVDFDDLFFSSVAPPDMYQQSLHFIDLLYEQPPILEQVIGDPEVERSLPDQMRGIYPGETEERQEAYQDWMEDQKPFFTYQVPEQMEQVEIVRSVVSGVEILPDEYIGTSTHPVEYVVEEPQTPTSIVPYVAPPLPPPHEPIFQYSVRGVHFTPLDPRSSTSSTSYTSDDSIPL